MALRLGRNISDWPACGVYPLGADLLKSSCRVRAAILQSGPAKSCVGVANCADDLVQIPFGKRHHGLPEWLERREAREQQAAHQTLEPGQTSRENADGQYSVQPATIKRRSNVDRPARSGVIRAG